MTTLEQVAAALRSPTRTIELLGDGKGRFIYAKAVGAALEIAETDGGLWLEFWRGDDEALIREVTIADGESAIAEASRWLEQRS